MKHSRNIKLGKEDQKNQFTANKVFCEACKLFRSKLGKWINIDVRNLCMILGDNEEDVCRTNNVEGDDFELINCSSQPDLRQRLKVMACKQKRLNHLLQQED